MAIDTLLANRHPKIDKSAQCLAVLGDALRLVFSTLPTSKSTVITCDQETLGSKPRYKVPFFNKSWMTMMPTTCKEAMMMCVLNRILYSTSFRYRLIGLRLRILWRRRRER